MIHYQDYFTPKQLMEDFLIERYTPLSDNISENVMGWGQLNLSEQGVKITHIPSKIVAISNSERSQLENMKKAMQKILEELIK